MLPSTTADSRRTNSSSPSSSSAPPPTPSSSSKPKDTPPSSNPNMTSRLAIPSGNSTDYYRRPNRSSASTPPSSYSYTPSSSTSHHHHHHHHSSHLHSHMTPQAYLTRLLDFQQMDIQSALDQMKTLCTTSPSRVYKTSYYRKQTKDHWARDDPAFFALQIVFLVGTSIAYVIAFRVEGLMGGILDFLIKGVVVHYLVWGVVMASLGRWFANEYLVKDLNGGGSGGSGGGSGGGGGGREIHVRQKVEWLYAFDIHCNAFFPMFVLLYAVQFFLLPLVLGQSYFALILSNTLYAAAFSWYFYITHLGYRALPFLTNTEVFLFPIAAVLAIFVLNLVGYPFGFGWNASRIMAYVFFD